MQKIILVALISIFFIACGGSEESAESVDNNDLDTVSVDTLPLDSLAIEVDPNRPVIDVDALFAKADKTYDVPFTVDTNFMETIEVSGDGLGQDYNLTGNEASFLAYSKVENLDFYFPSYIINTFIELDSIRTQGDWDAYQESLDLGQARFSNGNVQGVVKIDDATEILLWSIDYATYEACPYGYGTYVFGTLFTNRVATNTAVLAENSGGGDPPAWGDTRVNSVITADEITTVSIDRQGEEDYETGEEYTDTRRIDVINSISAQGMENVSTEGGDWSGDGY